MGVSVVGGCCGTTPEFIARLAAFSGREVEQPEPELRPSLPPERAVSF